MGKISKTPTGFTLIEVLTVSGIMALFALTTVSIFLATLRSGQKSQLIQRVHQEGDYALKTIASTVRKGETVTCSSGLLVQLPTGEKINFSLVDDNGVSRIASDSSNFLTGVVADASNFSVTCFLGNLGNQVVSLSFELTAGSQEGAQAQEKLTRTFATSISTRQQ